MVYDLFIIAPVRNLQGDMLCQYVDLIRELDPSLRVCKRSICETLKKPGHCLFLAMTATMRLVGTAQLVHVSGSNGAVGEVRDLCVTRSWRMRGVERALMEEVHRYGTLQYGVDRFDIVSPIGTDEVTLRALGYTWNDSIARYSLGLSLLPTGGAFCV